MITVKPCVQKKIFILQQIIPSFISYPIGVPRNDVNFDKRMIHAIFYVIIYSGEFAWGKDESTKFVEG
jgi:hypothetical protein